MGRRHRTPGRPEHPRRSGLRAVQPRRRQQVVRAVDIGQRAASTETLTGFGGATTGPTGGIAGPITDRLAPFSLAQLLPVSSLTGLPLGGNIVNLLPSNLPAGGLSFGIIGTNFNLNLALQALENQTKTRSLSKPEIVTVENAKASIVLGSEIPYATVSSAGTQIQFKEAALRLDVTPTVVYESADVKRIKMKLTVEDNSAGDTVNAGGGAAVPIINKRRAETEVLVKEGDTLVIGGITQRTDLESTRKVPIFGDIPVLGWLFKSRLVQTTPNRELVIFVTPSVLRRTRRAPLYRQAPRRRGKLAGHGGVFRFLTAGESHGEALVAVIDGVPAGLPLTEADINGDLARRQRGYGRGGRMKIERDQVHVLSGVRWGATLGSPITLSIANRDWENWKATMGIAVPEAGTAKKEVTRPRPGHADLAGAMKYGHRDIRNVLERSSARETTARVAVAGVAKRLLAEFGITILSHVTEIGGARIGELGIAWDEWRVARRPPRSAARIPRPRPR